MHVQQENNNATVADEVDPELLAKVLVNSEMRALLNSLAKMQIMFKRNASSATAERLFHF